MAVVAMEATEVVPMLNPKSFLDLPAHLALQVLQDTKVMQVPREPRDTLENPDNQDLPVNQVHQDTLDRREHQAIMELQDHQANQATTVKREHLVIMALQVSQAALAYLVKTDTRELPDRQDLKVKQVHQVTQSHPKSLALLAHQDTLAKMEPQDTLAVLVLLVLPALLDSKDHLASPAQMAIQVDLDLRVMLELLATLELLARMDIPVHPARYLAPLDLWDLLAHLATMVLVVKMASQVDLVFPEKTDFPVLQDTQVRQAFQVSQAKMVILAQLVLLVTLAVQAQLAPKVNPVLLGTPVVQVQLVQ